MHFLTPDERLKEEIQRVLNTHMEYLEGGKIVLHCRFDGRLALVAPEDYPKDKESIPVFTYRELQGLYDHGNKKMFNDLYDVKMEFPNAVATGVSIKTIGGGFHVPE